MKDRTVFVVKFGVCIFPLLSFFSMFFAASLESSEGISFDRVMFGAYVLFLPCFGLGSAGYVFSVLSKCYHLSADVQYSVSLLFIIISLYIGYAVVWMTTF